MGSPLLLLRLEGPLQSWGVRSRWDVRDTGDEPSKSGVIGLLGAALGLPNGDPRLVTLDQELRMGVRIDQPGLRLTDFQTITGALLQADGRVKGKAENPSTIVSPRSYLQDAAFLVVLAGPEQLLQELAGALQRPRWPVFLGRKSCPPTRPVFEALTETYESLEQALDRHPWVSESVRERPSRLRCVIEDPNGTAIRPDQIQSSPIRMYGTRVVRLHWALPPAEGGV